MDIHNCVKCRFVVIRDERGYVAFALKPYCKIHEKNIDKVPECWNYEYNTNAGSSPH